MLQRSRSRRSLVWYYFDKIPNNMLKCTCKLCDNIFSSSQTSNLFQHLHNKHNSVYEDVQLRRKSGIEFFNDPHNVSIEPTPTSKNRVESTPTAVEPTLTAVEPTPTLKKMGRQPKSIIQSSVTALVESTSTKKTVESTPTAVEPTPTLKKRGRQPKSIIQPSVTAAVESTSKKKSVEHTPSSDESTPSSDEYTPSSDEYTPSSDEYTPSPKKKGRPPKSMIQPSRTVAVESEVIVNANDSTAHTNDSTNYTNNSAPLAKKLCIRDETKDIKTRALLKMIFVGLYSPSIVNDNGFREFVHALDPSFELPTKAIITKNWLPELAENIQRKMKLNISKAPFIALSVESWNYSQSKSFMTLTAHFIKDSWEISSIVLDTLDYTEEMTATSVALNFKRLTGEWNISNRIIASISNKLDVIIPSALRINGWEDVTCFGNSLNSVVEKAFMSVPELDSLLTKVTAIVTYFENNTRVLKTFASIQQQLGLPIHKLKRRNPRLWISVLSMLERMIEQIEAVNTNLYFLRKDQLCLSDDDVEIMKSFIEVLTPFEAATKELCTDHYTCVSKVIPIATLLQQVMSTVNSTDLDSQSILKNALIVQMQSSFSNLETNSKLAKATLLDPRFKQHAFMDSSALELAQKSLLKEAIDVDQKSQTKNADNSTIQTKNAFSSFWNLLDKKLTETGTTKASTSGAENECRRYFKEAVIPRDASALNWWKLNEVQFPNLKKLAQKYLAVPATSVPSKRLFTKQGDLFSARRNQVKPDYLKAIVLLSNNLQALKSET